MPVYQVHAKMVEDVLLVRVAIHLPVNVLVVLLVQIVKHVFYFTLFYFYFILLFIHLNNLEASNPCESNPCANGGTCVQEGDSFRCECQGGFTGPRCQSRLIFFFFFTFPR